MKAYLSALGTLAAALACTACCWLPPLLILALGTSAGAVEWLAPWQPYLLGFTAIQLAVGFYLAYRKTPCHHGACSIAHEKKRKVNRVVMWAVAAMVVALNLQHFSSHGPVKVEAMERDASGRVVLALEGLHCEGCANTLEDKLTQLPGVSSCEVSFEAQKAVLVLSDPEPSLDDLTMAVKEAGYLVRNEAPPKP